MVLKLYLLKAYDVLKWSFVTKVLSSMGFPSHLVNLIKRCISSVSYKVLLNGQPSKKFLLNGHSKYLGFSVVLGRSKKDIFASVVERDWKNNKGWKEQFLCYVGKEVLIKAVAQAIPKYTYAGDILYRR